METNWSAERKHAYHLAKQRPGTVHRFQDEDGMRQVKFTSGTEPTEFAGEIIDDGKPGHWYESQVRDDTKIADSNEAVGFRIYEKGGSFADV